MGQIILGFIGAYLLYNFIFRFLIPLIKVTRQVRRQVRDFQQHVNTRQGEYQPGAGGNGGFQPGGSASGHYQSGGFRVEDFGTQSSGPTYGGTSAGSSSGAARQETKPKKDDYIDFEEIK
ncbi:hypothetical protein ACX0G7_10835 [Flavitalea antarctica]